MFKKLMALSLVFILPFAGYLLLEKFGTNAIKMPKHYFLPDTVLKTERRGKIVWDTVWHKVPNFKMTNQLGEQVSLDDLKNKIIVINFFFTRCPTICPRLTRQMLKLQNSFSRVKYINEDNKDKFSKNISDTIVQFISVSLDPEHDSVPNLRKYADRFNVNHDNWWLVNMPKEEIARLAMKELKANIADTKVDSAFIHTKQFFLLDKDRVVRGFFDGDDSLKQRELVRSIPVLMLEKDRKKPSKLRELIPVLPYVFVGIGFLFVVMYLLNKKRKKY